MMQELNQIIVNRNSAEKDQGGLIRSRICNNQRNFH